MQLIDTKIEIFCMPNLALSNYFTHSILIQLKIPLEVLFPLVRGAFLLEEKKFRIKSEGGKLFAQSWWCLSALHHTLTNFQRPPIRETRSAAEVVQSGDSKTP